MIRICVSDTGIGMSDQEQKKLFNAFVQASDSTSRKYGGTGLGLTISKRLVEAMGGQISVESTEGIGSTFSFTFPLVETEERESAMFLNQLEHGQYPIVIIDDNQAVLDTLERTLTRIGFPVRCIASSVESVVQIVDYISSGQLPKIILVDLIMPEMDGLETIQRFATLTEGQKPEIILMAAHQDVDHFQNGIKVYGIEHILHKPVNTAHLLDTLVDIFKGNKTKKSQKVGSIDVAQTVRAVREGLKLLLVEDNEMNQMVGVGVLEQAGFYVDVADTGVSALEKIGKQSADDQYHLVIMDVEMPEMNGFEATKVLRSQAQYVNLPIIAMTAHAFEEQRNACFEAGMNDHIPKPIDARELISTVNYWISKYDNQDGFHK
ncbi:hypothetical protein OLMES_0196 [Oleiphilus messinensis]|uniref:histidine kinase n=1 Tax=Oleiphilus messinensis TaxID=141451 RepID=A0A1Y0I4I4_9GAMM|nr:response regulator [Oleiphilus messinensis]ARU54303.1 hypothetical protein OLMES_0196 [Oleiphilus messinensis]